MSINFRLSKVPSGEDWKVFQVIGDSAEECQAAIDRLIDSGEACTIDRFVSRIIVDPPPRDEAGRPIARRA